MCKTKKKIYFWGGQFFFVIIFCESLSFYLSCFLARKMLCKKVTEKKKTQKMNKKINK